MELRYQLKGPEEKWDVFGSPEDIYFHCKKLGYKGPTEIVGGLPLPKGKDFVIQEEYIKKTSALRLQHVEWNLIDKFIANDDYPELTSRVDVMLFALSTLRQVKEFGSVYASMPDNKIHEFESIFEVIAQMKYFDITETYPVISKSKEDLKRLHKK
ncbi:MAG: hypothetical protein AAFY71_17505 [Bacteroidota bacterium]